MQEIIEHIDSLLDEECSRLEIIESLISEFGSDYPDYDYTKWREIVTKRIAETADEDDEEDLSFIPEPTVISLKDKYEQAKKKETKTYGPSAAAKAALGILGVGMVAGTALVVGVDRVMKKIE